MFAVKVARIRDGEDKICEKLKQELDICKNLRHRHIVACLGHEFVNSRLYIYLEYVPGGSLRQMVNKFGPLEAGLLVKATRGMLKGLNYLHKRNPPVVHRDLKGANVLINLEFCVKLADFGCSKCDEMSKSFSKVGSIHWVAPEVLQDAGHGRRADIWSLGCVILEMATAADPWGSGAFDNIMQAMYVIASSQRTPPVPDVLPDLAQSFLSQCLQRSPEDRSSASQLLTHPFIQSESGTPECCFSRPGSTK
jgi:serine/threonine protein kinase